MRVSTRQVSGVRCRSAVRVDNERPLTFICRVGESVREDLYTKFAQIHQALELPRVVVFVTHNRRRGAWWSGAASTAATPDWYFRRRGRLYELAHPAYRIKVRAGDYIGPAERDRYAWVGSLTGEGTLLHIVTHELVHIRYRIDKRAALERSVTSRAVHVCRELFPDLFAANREEWVSWMHDVIRFGDNGTQRECRKDTVVSLFEEGVCSMQLQSPQADRVTVRVRHAGKGNKPFVHNVYDAAPEKVNDIVDNALKTAAVKGPEATIKALKALAGSK